MTKEERGIVWLALFPEALLSIPETRLPTMEFRQLVSRLLQSTWELQMHQDGIHVEKRPKSLSEGKSRAW